MSSYQIEVKIVESPKELDIAHEIRFRVFVEEQGVDHHLEYDQFEDLANHYLAYFNGQPVGTARWRSTANGIKMERFAVLDDSRNLGVGSFLIAHMLKDVPADKLIYLHAQEQAVEIYKRHGFKTVDEPFEEAGIMHFKMILSPK